MQTKLDKAFKIIVDISNRKVTIPQAISWYVTDENIAHLYCQIIDEVEDSIIDIQSYKLSMRVLTPSRILKEVNYTLSDATNNIFTLTLPDELITEKGRHQCELSIEYLGDKLTSEPFNYNIMQSIANQLDSTISKDSHYPLVLELEDKLKEWNNILDEQVSKVIILDNDCRNAEKTRQANEAQRIADEAIRAEFYGSFSSQLAHIENKIHISVKEFGAKGDGLTDDTQAFYDCISYAIENNKSVYVPKGVYILTHGVLTFNLLDNQLFVMKGDGASSILKRKDNTVTKDWCGIFTFSSDSANTKDVELIKIQDLKIDSNARNQIEPENSYGFEHCYDVRVSGKPNSRIKTVHIEGVYATDGVADHIYIAGSTDAYVDNFIVNNFQCDYRTRTRSDLCVTGYIKTGIFTNIKCIVLEYEFNNAEGLGDSYIFINNLETENLDLGGAGLICHATNMTVKRATYLASVKGHIANSSITFSGGRVIYTKGLEFNGCTFYVIEDSNGTINPVYIQYPNIIDFRNCYFKVKSDVEVYQDALLSILPITEGMQINIDSCEFDSKAQAAIRADRCGTVSVSNCKFYNYYPLILSGAPTYTLNVTLNNLIMLGEGYSLYIGAGNITSLVINNMICNEKNLRIKPENSACDKFGELFVDRKIIISSPFTKTWLKNDINNGGRNIYLFNGDTFVNKNSLPNEPRCWRVTKTSYAHDLNAMYWNIATMNDGVGTTDERPTCYLSRGYQYFDTTLGRTITWDGSDWI